MEHVDCVVIGAGIIGLAIARELALAGREVIILEGNVDIGTGVSSRTNEAIPAEADGPASALKIRLCAMGASLIRDYAARHGVRFNKCGKLTIAQTAAEVSTLEAMQARMMGRGTPTTRLISRDELAEMEPLLAKTCTMALYSPDSGVIDSHDLMLSLLAEAEAHGAQLVCNAPVLSGCTGFNGIELDIGGPEPARISASEVLLCAGLGTVPLANRMKLANVPHQYYAKGHYFALSGKAPFSHMIYPVRLPPPPAGEAAPIRPKPFVPDISGRGLFGPDIEWVTDEDYSIPAVRADAYYAGARLYWPELPDGALTPAFAGIRPEIRGPHDAPVDFRIDGPSRTGALGIYALYGIGAPGMTASLALAHHVAGMLKFQRMAAQ